MTDPFANSAGLAPITGQGIEQSINVRQMQRQRAIDAYRNNIALPDVHIADRNDRTPPRVVAEDGEELTPERRAQLMREAGVRPMFSEDGKATDQEYDGHEFDGVVETERLGKTAEENRGPVRVVQPRELQIEVEIDVAGSSLQVAKLGSNDEPPTKENDG